MSALQAEADADAQQESDTAYVNDSGEIAQGREVGLPVRTKNDDLVALLQLKDGSMYGLTDYWVQDGQLHYRTTYGGENTVPLDRIDMPKTLQLNADRGAPFQLDRQKQ